MMERNSIGVLVNSISRFIHLVACQNGRTAALRDFRNIADILKLLKPVMDEASDYKIPSDEQFSTPLKELDIVVGEAREFMEKRPRRISKICSVLQSEAMLLKVQKASMEIFDAMSKLIDSMDHKGTCRKGFQHCMQEIQCEQPDLISEVIEVSLKDLRENVVPSIEDIIKITETLGLRSNQELLIESIALEKERIRAEFSRKSEDVDRIDQIIGLVTHIRYCIAKLQQFGVMYGLPIPLYFRCPLSLELMSDPVILSSGITYERSFIQKWLDNGLKICPKTRQLLSHSNLTTNFTVKAMISTWCEENNISSSHSIQPDSIIGPFSSTVALKDSGPGNYFRGSVLKDSTSGSSVECINHAEQQTSDLSSDYDARAAQLPCLIGCHQRVMDKNTLHDNPLPQQQSYHHSPSESISSVISSIEISSKLDEKLILLGEATNLSSSPAIKDPRFPSSLAKLGSDDLTTSTHIQELVEDLKSRDHEVQTSAASELRFLAKNNSENRILLAKCGVIPTLVPLLYSKVMKTQENAVTALLNLSINDDNKVSLAEAGAIEPLIRVLESGSTEARENSAATLFSISLLEEYKVTIGRSSAVKALVDLLGSGSLRGKKDAATALFNLSIFHENKARIVQAGAVKYLIDLMDPTTGMSEKSVALLANLSTIPEGRLAIVHEGGIQLLVEILETGSQRGKENAAAALLQLCVSSHKFCSLVLQEGAVPPLITLSQFGTPRAKEKAQQILSHFRSQREGTVRRKAKP